MNAKLRFRSTLKFGIIMGIGFCLYTTFMWLTKLDSSFLNIGQYLDMAIIILPVGIIFGAIRNQSRMYQVSIIQRITIAVWVSLISFLIYDPYLYVYHHYINPGWYDSVLHLKELELKASGASAVKILDTLKDMQSSNGVQLNLFNLSAFLSSVIILPLLISLLSLIFIRKGLAKEVK